MNTKTFYDAWDESLNKADESFAVDQAGAGFTIDSANSLGGLPSSIGVRPRGYSISTALSAIRKDETLYSAIVTKVDATVGNGWFLTSKNKQQLAKAEKFFDDSRADTWLRHLLFNLYPYGNAFVEIVPNSPEVYVIETTEVEIKDKAGHGVDYNIIQRNGNREIEFTPDKFVHFRLDRFSTSLWGEIPVRPLDQYVGIKILVKNHIWRLFKNNSFRSTILFPENTVDEDVNRSLAEHKLAAKDPNRPFVWFGGVDQKALQTYDDGPRFIETINACDKAILVQMQVPPIMAGVPDNSGRASGEQQTYKAFNTHIKSVQRYVEETITYELMPKLGFPSVEFHFNEIDSKSEKDVLDMAVQLKAMGAKADKLTEWLQEQGVDVPDDFFDPEFFVSPVQQGKQDMMMKNAIGNKSGSPSRQGANGARKSIGTGSSSSTRDDQIVTQSQEKEDPIEAALERLTNPAVKKRARELYNEGIIP